MSRGDWVTTAATLIVAGIAYFAGGPWGSRLAWACIGIGVAIFLILHFRGTKEHPLQSESGGSKIKDRGNVSASGNVAKATIGDINVYTAPPPAPRPIPLPRKAKVVYIEPPVPFLARVKIDSEEVWHKNGQRGVQALLLPFYLDPKKSDSGVYLEYAKVHMEFTPDNTSLRTIRVDHACWLNEIYDTTTISLGETKHVVLVLDSLDEKEPLHIVSTNRTESHWYTRHEEAMEIISLPRLLYSVTSVLIWGGNSDFKAEFPFPLDLTKQLS